MDANLIKNTGKLSLGLARSYYSILYDSVKVFKTAKKEQDVYDGIITAIKKSGLFDSACLCSIDEKSGELRFLSSYGDLDKYSKNGFIENTWNLKKPDVYECPPGIAAFPVFRNGEIYSILGISSVVENFFRGEPVEFLTAVTGLVENCLFSFDLKNEKENLEKKRKNIINKIKRISTHDKLTKLGKRKMFEENIKKAQLKSGRYKKVIYVIVLDLDDLRKFNDRYGSKTGDDVLVLVSKRLTVFRKVKNNFYKEEKSPVIIPAPPCRLGGDEFGIIVLMDDDPKNKAIEDFCGELRGNLSSPVHIENNMEYINASMGIAACRGAVGGTATEPKTLVRMANHALYRSKFMGKNSVNFFDKGEESNIVSYHQKVKEIKEALRLKEFVLYYQPKVSLKSGDVIGFESLIRRVGKEGNIIPPSEFIPVAEESDLIVEIGNFVFEDTFSQISKWVYEGTALPVSINISVRQLMKPDFLENIENILALYPNVPLGLIQLEITETAIMEDIEYVKGMIKKCKGRGLSFLIDDCGSGYSSLIYLKELPFDIVKIDMAFIRNMLVNKSDMLMVQSLLSLSKIMGKEIIAEGVETIDQGIVLKILGCDNVQGYYTGKPIRSDLVAGWIKKFSLSRKLNSWKDVKLNIGDFGDFLIILAYVGHNEFVEKIKKMLRDKKKIFSEAEIIKIKDYKTCEFGLWYYGEGVKYKNIDAYEELKKDHARVHEVAGMAVDLFLNGRHKEAGRLIRTIEDITEKIQANLLKLAKEVGRLPVS